MNRLLPLLALLLVGPLSGCLPENTTAEPTKKEPLRQAVNEALRPPAPTAAPHDARVVTLTATSNQISQLLGTIHKRLTSLKNALDEKQDSEKDLVKVVDLLRPLTIRAREDCDAILRVAKDLKTELAFARRSYEVTAELYRERAETYSDPSLKAVMIKMADELTRVAEDVPRRVLLTEAFIAQLLEMQTFLASADRCLGDTRAALAILSAGPDRVSISADGRLFREQLEVFLGVVEAYQQKMLRPVPKQPAPTPAVQPEPKESKAPHGAASAALTIGRAEAPPRLVTDEAKPAIKPPPSLKAEVSKPHQFPPSPPSPDGFRRAVGVQQVIYDGTGRPVFSSEPHAMLPTTFGSGSQPSKVFR